MTGPTLRLAGIVAGYGDARVLRGIDLVVGAGETVALLGPNGAGKTTLLRVASGLLRPERGSVTLFGRDVTGTRPHTRAATGLCHLPEGRGVFPDLTVRENLILQAEPGGEAAAVSRATKAFPRLAGRLSQVAGTLSGGEQKMLALSRAHVSNPRLVLVDEPSFGLAPALVDDVFAFLAGLAESGTSILLVEQYVDRALALADRVYVLRKGHIAAEGTPASILGTGVTGHYLGSRSETP